MMPFHKQPWIGRPVTDIMFILLPSFASLLLIVLFPHIFQASRGISDGMWILLILLIDVAHVYSTLYRTYFDPGSFRRQRFILTAIPFIGLVIGILAYAISSQLFWRLLAYTAVFHFVRQQYGFMRVYSRKEQLPRWSRLLDKATIYYATLYPLAFWHLSGPRNFNWFVEKDFIYLHSPLLLTVFTVAYYALVVAYLGKELFFLIRDGYFNLPKFAIITGTLLSWYFGIVYFNGDLVFTFLNVVSHGIPYMALIWIYGKKHYSLKETGSRFLQLVFSRYGIFIFLGVVFLLAFVEEGLWDVAVWQDHPSIFGSARMPFGFMNDRALTFLIPLLALPQVTHYILDGFIWKIKKDDFRWTNDLTGSNPPA